MNRTRRTALAMTAGVGLLTAGLPAAVSAAAPASSDLKAQVAEQLGVPASQLADGERRSAVGLTQVRFQQEVGGVPVLGAQGVATLGPDGVLLSVSGRVETTTKVVGANGRSALAKSVAKGAAVGHAKKVTNLPANKITTDSGRAVLVDRGLVEGAPTGQLKPGIQFTVSGADGASGTITVDTFSGAVLNDAFGVVRVNRAICDRNNEYDTSACDYDSATRAEGDPESSIGDVNDAYAHLGNASTWFDQALGLDITDKIGADVGDGNGKALRALTRVCYLSCPDAAYWNHNTKTIYLGPGFVNDDVIGHEMGHGISMSHGIAYTPGGGEYGGISEHMSDVFGEAFDLQTPTGLDGAEYDWQIGEDAVPTFGRLIRDMENPASLGDPERYSDFNTSGSSHSNAGIGNKTAYLIAAGGSFNGQTVSGIGVSKMVKLFYAVNSAMTTHPTYADEGSLLKSQCTALTTTGDLTADDCTNVEKATAATEIGGTTTEPTKGNGKGGGKGGGKPKTH